MTQAKSFVFEFSVYGFTNAIASRWTRDHGAVYTEQGEHMAPQRLPLAKLLQNKLSRILTKPLF